MKVERMEVTHAAGQLAELVTGISQSYGHVVLLEEGRERAAILPIQAYRTLMGERQLRVDEFRRAGERIPVYPEEEVERDIAEALAWVRGKRGSVDESESLE